MGVGWRWDGKSSIRKHVYDIAMPEYGMIGMGEGMVMMVMVMVMAKDGL